MKVSVESYNKASRITNEAKKLGFLARQNILFLPNKEQFDSDNENYIIGGFDEFEVKYIVYSVISSNTTDLKGMSYSLDDFDTIMDVLKKRMKEYKDFLNKEKLEELENDFEY